ncbi:MAG TPA: DUF2147 domain-containing protein [Roseiarcus sp.]|nr:DUF2147 domain-containing protein [Roseiarcus sp.]
MAQFTIYKCGLLIGIAAGLLSASAASAGWTANGEWARDDGLVRTRLAPCGGKICAINTWANDPGGDERPGDEFVMTLIATDPRHWTGSAFDARRNLNYSMDLTIEGRQLMTRGCLAGSSLCRTAAWTRVGK